MHSVGVRGPGPDGTGGDGVVAGGGEGLDVDLPVGGKREALEGHERNRHHVVGEPGGEELS